MIAFFFSLSSHKNKPHHEAIKKFNGYPPFLLFLLQLTFYNYITVDETVTYKPHPEDRTKTLLTQEAVVKVHGVPLTHYMEDLLTSKISFNAGKVNHFIYLLIFISVWDSSLGFESRSFRRGFDTNVVWLR